MIKDVGAGGYVQADVIEIGENVKFGKSVEIKVRGTLRIGSNSVIGDRFKAKAENLTIGEYFYNVPTDSRGMVIGGGGSDFPWANLHIGDKVVCHTGHINLAQQVIIGDRTGLSHDVDIITHGFWGSVLEGYPRKLQRVTIGNNVIVGWKTTILPGVYIDNNITIGANSVVTKSLLGERGIFAGNPARLIGASSELDDIRKESMIHTILKDWDELMEYYEHPPIFTEFVAPNTIIVNNLRIDVDNMMCEGTHDEVTDAFRDFIRRYGIRVFHPRGFAFKLERI